MHCGKKNSVAISLLKNASLPGLLFQGNIYLIGNLSFLLYNLGRICEKSTPGELWCMGHTRSVTRRSRETSLIQ